MDKNTLLEILHHEIVPSLGVTEPGAVALCTAAASNNNQIKTTAINLTVSPNIYKNCMSVGIPGLQEKGIVAAAALGAIAGDYHLGLEALSHINEEDTMLYQHFIRTANINVSISDQNELLYIEAFCEGENGFGSCIIRESHDNIVFMQHNGTTVLDHTSSSYKNIENNSGDQLKAATVSELLDIIEQLEEDDLALLKTGAEKNLHAAQWGLAHRPGMGAGAALMDLQKKGIIEPSLLTQLQMYTAAASDVRVSGSFMPIMTCAGSGNHGITAFVPVAKAAEHFGSSPVKTLKALAISNLLTVYIKNYSGKLSGMCGCGVAAATGVAAALTYLMGGTVRQIEHSIKNMAGDITGIICDGAKDGCSLKLSTAVSSAFRAATFAISGIVIPDDNGIVALTSEKTMQNMGKISSQGMAPTDITILDIMQNCK